MLILTTEQRRGAARLPADLICQSQRVERVGLIVRLAQPRQLLQPIGEERLQQLAMLAAGAQAVECGVVDPFAE